MDRLNKEDYIGSNNSAKGTKINDQIFQIDKILHQMQSIYRANIEAQECYIDILKCNNKNINSKYIKSIYALFSQSKANQICFQKQWRKTGSFDFHEKLLRRYYARMIQMVIRKISYFWMNSSSLQFLSSHIIKLMKLIRTCFNQIHRIKNLQFHFEVMRMFFHENALIQQKIYDLLIDEGYLISMDEFYRINGIDLVADQQYYRKTHTKLESPSIQDSQEQSYSKKQESHMKYKAKSSKDSKRVWGQNKIQTPIVSQNHLQKTKTKIKDMVQSIVRVLRLSLQQQKQIFPQLEIIEEQNDQIAKTQRENIQQNGETLINQNKTKKRLSSVALPETRKRINQKKMSIQLMSYFSKQFKSVLSEAPQMDINCLSQLLVASQTHSKSLPTALIKMNGNQPSFIHSLKSLESLQRIKQQKKRGKLIQMALKNKNAETLSQMCQSINQSTPMEFRVNSLRHKFSFKSTPGVYITVPKKKQSRLKMQSKKSKNQNGINKFVIRQNIGKDHIFQNQLIVNQLTSKQTQDYINKVDFTDINGDSLMNGVLSPKMLRLTKQNLQKLNNQKKLIINLQKRFNQQQKYVQLGKLVKNNNKIKQRLRKTGWTDKNNLINLTEWKFQNRGKIDEEQQKNNYSHRFSYTIYDRLRRRIIHPR